VSEPVDPSGESPDSETPGRRDGQTKLAPLHACGKPPVQGMKSGSCCAGAPSRRSLARGSACIADRPTSRSSPRRGPSGNPRRTPEDEAHIPTQHPPPSQEARLSSTHEHSRRTRGPQVAPCQGPGSALGLIHRVRTRREFSLLSSSGRRVRTELLWCTYSPDDSIPAPRVAFAIGRAFGSAVARNRARRQIREAVSRRHLRAPLRPGRYLIGITRSVNVHMFPTTFPEVEAKVDDLLDTVERCSVD
jgi:ribonuclease P protein component